MDRGQAYKFEAAAVFCGALMEAESADLSAIDSAQGEPEAGDSAADSSSQASDVSVRARAQEEDVQRPLESQGGAR